MLSWFILFSCANDVQETYDLTAKPCHNIAFDSTKVLKDKIAEFCDFAHDSTGVYLFEQGEEALIARAWLSEYANESIDIQYFIFSMDNVGILATEYLLRSANKGVKIRILVDDLMIDTRPEYLLALNLHPNFSIKIYNPNLTVGKNLPEKIFNTITDFKGINQRMHNKTFIVDRFVSITGGRNIANEYFDYDHEYNFRDRDILIMGNAVNQIHDSFEEFWSNDLSVDVNEIVNSKITQQEAQEIYQWLYHYACDDQNLWPQIKSKIDRIPELFTQILKSNKFIWADDVIFVSDHPGKNASTSGLQGGGNSTDSLIKLVGNATKEIIIHSPYLVTTDLGLKLFTDCVERGVNVNIITNSLSSTDNIEAFSGYQRSRKSLLKAGVNIYEYQPDAKIQFDLMQSELQRKLDFVPIFGLHSKSMVIDESITVVGTFNLDPRSANLNTECITIVKSLDFNLLASEIMRQEMLTENSYKVSLKHNSDFEAGISKRSKTFFRRIIPKSIL